MPQRYPANPQLGKWVNNLRSRKEVLSDDRVDHLVELGFNWGGTRVTVSWDERLKQLREYQSKHGNCNVPQKYASNPQSAL